MELLCPSFFPIHFGKNNHHGRFEFEYFFVSQFLATINFVENGFDFSFGIIFSIKLFNSVVRKFTTQFGKEILTFAKCLYHIVESGDGNARNFSQLLNISAEVCRVFYSHSFIRTPCRKHFYPEIVIFGFNVMFEWIHRIISSTNYLNFIF